MNHPTRILTTLAAPILVAMIIGCGGEDTIVDPPAPSFLVTVEVTDPSGAPVSGLAMSVAPDGPWYGEKTSGEEDPGAAVEQLHQPFPCPFNPVVTLEIELDAARDVRLAVEDIAGGVVRILIDEPRSAGTNQVVWNGLDDAGDQLPSGIYRGHLVLRDETTDDVVLDQSQPMLLAVLDPDQYSVGTTDAAGRIALEDERLFPYLAGIAGFPATDENGEQTGTINLTAAVRFELLNPATGDRMRFTRDVAGNAFLRFTWDPAP